MHILLWHGVGGFWSDLPVGKIVFVLIILLILALERWPKRSK